MALNLVDEQQIRALSRSDVELTTSGLKRFIDNSKWIGRTNRYAYNAIERLKADYPRKHGRVRNNPGGRNNLQRSRNLAQYIAASAVLHSFDGWSYLGRSLACLLTGDAHRALHLAYYAELRAALSLLAGSGIGIFKERHFIINRPNTTSLLQSGFPTHVMTWDALEFWSRQPYSGVLFAKLIRPQGRTLDDWFQPHGGSTILAPQAQSWFKQWGMDLKLAIKDREARNDSSYRPDGIPTPWIIPPRDILDFTRSLWPALEPSGLSNFQELDRLILRLALESYFRGRYGSEPSALNPTFVALVRTTVQSQDLPGATGERWIDFLLRNSASSDPTIFAYSAIPPGDPATEHFAVISRAVLLLRAATGSAHDLLQQAGFNASALAFWWEAVGTARGLWDPTTPPASLSDLWADVRDTLSEVQQFVTDNVAATGSVNWIASGLGKHFHTLCSHERVGLWGLCPM